MLIEVQTLDGPQKVRVCDYCRTVCIPGGRFCSGRCAREFDEQQLRAAEDELEQVRRSPGGN